MSKSRYVKRRRCDKEVKCKRQELECQFRQKIRALIRDERYDDAKVTKKPKTSGWETW